MSERTVHVSDHAVLRYLERVGGFEIDRLRAEIAERVGRTYAKGATNVIIDGFRYVIEVADNGPVVVTVFQKTNAPCLSQRARR